MRPSIKHHIFRQFFTLSVLTVITLISLVELLSDDLEENMVALELKFEQTHYLPKIDNVAQTWKTSTALVSFVPNKTKHYPKLPRVFQGLPIPFSGEVEGLDKEYWVDVSRLPTGVMYVAKDTSLFEQREEVFLFGIAIIGGLFIVISFVLTQLSARRIVKPLTKLTQEISHIDPQNRSIRISEKYHDQELYSIASTFNAYLNTIEEYIKREQMLIGMASHELRTPTAVISGALDVIEARETMTEQDKKTVGRIRSATNEMNANIVAILMLARKQETNRPFTKILLSQRLQAILQERLNTHPQNPIRLSILPSDVNHKLVCDITLVNMLLRNLIQNALEHTQGNVTLQQNEVGLLISDEGSGLPQNVRLQLEQKKTHPNGNENESGLGLFIVTLICERLNWQIEVNKQAKKGMKLQLNFFATD
ncbi:MAG: HAMP domain-containing histidine kinase [Gammaproteobacteria bacterium]|nr:HAMP domain-containing histidine kinase [Gammaproteobacteria bacterium]